MSALESLCPPVLSCAAARELESARLRGDEAREWQAMQAAGRAIAGAVRLDFLESQPWPAAPRLLVLVGKGHNGGDAMIAAQALLQAFPAATADVLFVFGERNLRPLAARAWRDLVHAVPARARAVTSVGDGAAYDLCLDGVFGFQFRAPAEPRVAELLESVNRISIRVRAAVDLPSADLFRADFTYATGSVKEPVLANEKAGRVRYLDLGFFDGEARPGDDRVLTAAVLEPLRQLRRPATDKRHYGRVFLVGGSRGFPGAILMATLGAIRSGAGLVTSFVPESLVPAFAARLPEAMWVGWPETPEGGLSLEGEHLLHERIERADSLVLGPGMGRERETLALAESIVARSRAPLVIDADALQPAIVVAGKAPRVITPHAGEFKRVAGAEDLRTFARHPDLTVVLKGPVTRVCDGGPVYHSFFGGPVLARGGSGDVLAGMIGTQLAQSPETPLPAAVRAVAWHGAAADALARSHGQVAVETTQLLEYLGAVLRCD